MDYLGQVGDCEGGAVDSITGADTYADIGLFDCYEVIGAVPHHTYFEAAVAKNFVDTFAGLKFLLLYLFVFFDDQSFILWRYPCKHFDLIMEKSIRSFGDEIVINGVDFLRVVGEVKNIQFRFVLYDLPHFIFKQF